MKRLLAFALAGLAGCGSGKDRQPSDDVYRAQADEACVKFLRHPISALTDPSRNAEMERLAWLDEGLRRALPPEQPPAGPFRRRVYDPVRNMSRRIREAIGEIESGAPARRVARDVRREHDAFRAAYLGSAAPLKLERCRREQALAAEQEAAFHRAVARICGRRRGALRRLDALDAPARLRPLWREAIRGARTGDERRAARAFRAVAAGDCAEAL